MFVGYTVNPADKAGFFYGKMVRITPYVFLNTIAPANCGGYCPQTKIKQNL
jgi:hypothetical protein